MTDSTHCAVMHPTCCHPTWRLYIEQAIGRHHCPSSAQIWTALEANASGVHRSAPADGWQHSAAKKLLATHGNCIYVHKLQRRSPPNATDEQTAPEPITTVFEREEETVVYFGLHEQVQQGVDHMNPLSFQNR